MNVSNKIRSDHYYNPNEYHNRFFKLDQMKDGPSLASLIRPFNKGKQKDVIVRFLMANPDAIASFVR